MEYKYILTRGKTIWKVTLEDGIYRISLTREGYDTVSIPFSLEEIDYIKLYKLDEELLLAT